SGSQGDGGSVARERGSLAAPDPFKSPLQDALDEMLVAPSLERCQDYQVARLRVETRKRVHLQEVGNSVAQAEVESAHVPAAQGTPGKEGGFGDLSQCLLREVRRAFVADRSPKVALDLQTIDEVLGWLHGQHAHDADDLRRVVPDDADGQLVALNELLDQHR